MDMCCLLLTTVAVVVVVAGNQAEILITCPSEHLTSCSARAHTPRTSAAEAGAGVEVLSRRRCRCGHRHPQAQSPIMGVNWAAVRDTHTSW